MHRVSGKLLVCTTVLTLTVVACASSSGSSDGASTTLSDEESEVAAVAGEVVDACQDRDRDRLRDLSGDQLRLQIQDRDYDQFFNDCERYEIMERTVGVDGDTAQVRFRYRLRDGDVERDCMFEFERRGAAGPWRLRALPDCPLD